MVTLKDKVVVITGASSGIGKATAAAFAKKGSMIVLAARRIEKLEQLRAIENGYSILVGKIKHRCEGIDTPEQYAEFVSDYLSKTKKT